MSTLVDIFAKQHFEKGSWLRKYLGVLACFPILLTPFVVSRSEGAALGLVSMAAPFYFLRNWQACTNERFENVSIIHRIAHVGLTFHDLRFCRLGVSWPERKAILQTGIKSLVLDSLLLVGCLAVLQARDTWPRNLSVAAGSLAVGIYALVSLKLFDASLQIYNAFLDIEVPRVMKQPEAALSVGQFWGECWDTVIQQLLQTHIYIPLQNRLGFSPVLAMLTTFLVSGFVHVWPLFVAGLSPEYSLMMTGYFVVQAFFVIAERALRISYWKSTFARHVWTLAAVCIPLPLVAAPTLAFMGGML